MTEQVGSSRVKSDLLHMIDGAFGDAGIAISHSQRDIRLSTDDPLPVVVVSSMAGRAVREIWVTVFVPRGRHCGAEAHQIPTERRRFTDNFSRARRYAVIKFR